MTADQISIIRNLRACNVPWPRIAKELEATVLECRTAIGLPTYGTPKRQALPWDIQRGLFDDQPDMQAVSDK